MRSSWIGGNASGLGDNIPGRYITPWREGGALNADGSGQDDPFTYPFGPMRVGQFMWTVARVYSWKFKWAVSFNGPNYQYSAGGETIVEPVPLNPPIGQADALLNNEEHRIMAGFSYFNFREFEVGNQPASELCRINGLHQYILPGAGINQQFRPRFIFQYRIPGTDEDNSAQWSVLPDRIEAQSIGQSRWLIPSYDEDEEPTYDSVQGMVFSPGGFPKFAGPSTASASLTVTPHRWWEYRNGLGADPIYDATSGAILRSTRAEPSTQPVGDEIVDARIIGGRRFCA